MPCFANQRFWHFPQGKALLYTKIYKNTSCFVWVLFLFLFCLFLSKSNETHFAEHFFGCQPMTGFCVLVDWKNLYFVSIASNFIQGGSTRCTELWPFWRLRGTKAKTGGTTENETWMAQRFRGVVRVARIIDSRGKTWNLLVDFNDWLTRWPWIDEVANCLGRLQQDRWFGKCSVPAVICTYLRGLIWPVLGSESACGSADLLQQMWRFYDHYQPIDKALLFFMFA